MRAEVRPVDPDFAIIEWRLTVAFFRARRPRAAENEELTQGISRLFHVTNIFKKIIDGSTTL
jgi:hypothetical protein